MDLTVLKPYARAGPILQIPPMITERVDGEIWMKWYLVSQAGKPKLPLCTCDCSFMGQGGSLQSGCCLLVLAVEFEWWYPFINDQSHRGSTVFPNQNDATIPLSSQKRGKKGTIVKGTGNFYVPWKFKILTVSFISFVWLS